MIISPFATKERVRRLEARVAELEARPVESERLAGATLPASEARLRAHREAVARIAGAGPRPGPVVLH